MKVESGHTPVQKYQQRSTLIVTYQTKHQRKWKPDAWPSHTGCADPLLTAQAGHIRVNCRFVKCPTETRASGGCVLMLYSGSASPATSTSETCD